ncbi:glucosaminidase domain-containing protein [Cysteiniphilum sp. JM-1]|uniref:glucosaminidase domain-containing protein n=1 Tax=Cysteiniphilum sp. JM-1 TaxID=2610891 RepID=UPI00168CBFFC|nr:glucosaminidase domain-containing protein [Cysteiniphilum sp. JM-1]
MLKISKKELLRLSISGFLAISLASFITSCSKNTETTLEKPDFQAISSVSDRKQAFIDYMLPFIHQVQQDVLNQRQALESMLAMLNKNKKLSKTQQDQLSRFCEQYKVNFDENALTQMLKDLLIKVNTIPTSMVLAQAALETGWGTSRFAVDGNNYFGQHCFTKGCGIVPKQRTAGAINEVQVFPSPKDSVQSYFNLLNTGTNFQEFRTLRSQLTKEDKPITGKDLIKTLVHYSELEDGEYEKRIISTMDYNNLYQYN